MGRDVPKKPLSRGDMHVMPGAFPWLVQSRRVAWFRNYASHELPQDLRAHRVGPGRREQGDPAQRLQRLHDLEDRHQGSLPPQENHGRAARKPISSEVGPLRSGGGDYLISSVTNPGQVKCTVPVSRNTNQIFEISNRAGVEPHLWLFQTARFRCHCVPG
jgi:hypothetical protein